MKRPTIRPPRSTPGQHGQAASSLSSALYVLLSHRKIIHYETAISAVYQFTCKLQRHVRLLYPYSVSRRKARWLHLLLYAGRKIHRHPVGSVLWLRRLSRCRRRAYFWDCFCRRRMTISWQVLRQHQRRFDYSERLCDTAWPSSAHRRDVRTDQDVEGLHYRSIRYAQFLQLRFECVVRVLRDEARMLNGSLCEQEEQSTRRIFICAMNI